MRKFINFAKKPLLFITAGIFVVFTILLIIISCLPKGSKYEYRFSAMGVTMEIDYSFKGDEVTVDTYVMNEHDSAKTTYKINKGDLYVVNLDSNEWEYVGEINAFEIVMKASAEETGIGNMEIVLVCKANKALRTVSIVFMCVSGVLAAACAALYFLDKKGKLKFLENRGIVAPVAENTEESIESSAPIEEVIEQENTEQIQENQDFEDVQPEVETEDNQEKSE